MPQRSDVLIVVIPFSIDPATGSLLLGDADLCAHESKSEIEVKVAHLVTGSRDNKDGYEWLHLGGLTFHGMPATLSLRFHNGLFDRARWQVELPGAPTDCGWPTRKAIDEEIAFVRTALARDIAFDLKRKLPQEFAWGRVWSAYDGKEGVASNGLQYGCEQERFHNSQAAKRAEPHTLTFAIRRYLRACRFSLRRRYR